MAEPSPLRQHAWFKRAAGLAAAMLLGACQTIVPKAPPPPPPAPVEAPRIDTGSLPSDEARNRVALLVPISGPNAAVGQSIANAANLAILDTGGARVRVTTYDTGAGASAAAARALADGNRLFLGPLLAEEVRAVAAAARPAGVPVIAFSNDTSVAGNGTYLMGFSPTQSIERVVRYAKIARDHALCRADADGRLWPQRFERADQGGRGGRRQRRFDADVRSQPAIARGGGGQAGAGEGAGRAGL